MAGSKIVHLPRRHFLKRALRLAGGAAVLLAGGAPGAIAQIVAEDDRRLLNTMESFRTRRGRASGYLSRSRGAGPARPGILLVHGAEGLTPYYRDMARRLALEGFVVLAPDFLSLVQGTPNDAETARAMIEAVDRQTAVALAMGAVDFLVARRETQRRLGVVGFDWGGLVAQELALEARDIVAAVSVAGDLLAPERIARLRSPLMVHHAAGEEDADAALEAFAEALASAGARHTIHRYEGAPRLFHDQTSQSYDAEAAELAWTRTVAFLRQTLG